MNGVEFTAWSGADLPDRNDLEAALRSEGMVPRWWSDPPGDRYDGHSHSYHKVLFCVRGSIVFRLDGEGLDLELRPGDRLDLPPNTAHSAVVGPEGVVCVEGARR